MSTTVINKQQSFHQRTNSILYEEEPSFSNDNFKTSTPHKSINGITSSSYKSNKKREELELSDEELEEEDNNNNSNLNSYDKTRLTRKSLAAFSSSSSPTTPSLQRQQQQQQLKSTSPIPTTRINNSPSSIRLNNSNSVVSNITRDLLSQQSSSYVNPAPPSTGSSTLVEDRYERSNSVTRNLKGKGEELRDSEAIKGIRESGYSPSYSFKEAEETEDSREEEEEEEEEDIDIDREIEEELSSSPHRTTTTRRTTEELSNFLDKKVAARTSISSASSTSTHSTPPVLPAPPPPPLTPRLSSTPTTTPSPQKTRLRSLPFTTTTTTTTIPNSSPSNPSTPHAPGSFPLASPAVRRSSLPLLSTRLPPPPPPPLISPRLSPSTLNTTSSNNNNSNGHNRSPSGTVQVQLAFNKYINGPEGALTLSAERRRKTQSISEQGSVQREQIRLEREKEKEKEKEVPPLTPRMTIGRFPETPIHSSLGVEVEKVIEHKVEKKGIEVVDMLPTNQYDPVVVIPRCVETEDLRHSKDLLEFNNGRRRSLKSAGEEVGSIQIEAKAPVEELDLEPKVGGTEVYYIEGRSRGYEGDYSDEEEEEDDDETELEDINQRSTVKFAMADNTLEEESEPEEEAELKVDISPPLTPSISNLSSISKTSSYEKVYTPALPPSPTRSVSPPLPPLIPTPTSSPYKSSRFRQPQPANSRNSISEEWPRTPAYYSNPNTPRTSFSGSPAVTTTSGSKKVRRMSVVQEVEPASPFAPTSSATPSPKPGSSPIVKSVSRTEEEETGSGTTTPISITTVPRLPFNSIAPSPKYRHSSSRPKSNSPSTSPTPPSISAFVSTPSTTSPALPAVVAVKPIAPTPPSPAPRLPQLNSSSHFRSPSMVAPFSTSNSPSMNNSASSSPAAVLSSTRRVASISNVNHSPIPTSPLPATNVRQSFPSSPNHITRPSISSSNISVMATKPSPRPQPPLQSTSVYDPPSSNPLPILPPTSTSSSSSTTIPAAINPTPAILNSSASTTTEIKRVIPVRNHNRNVSMANFNSIYDPPSSLAFPSSSPSTIPRKISNPIAPPSTFSTTNYDPPAAVTLVSQNDRKVSTASSTSTSDYDLPSSITTSPSIRKISIPTVPSPSTSNYDPVTLSSQNDRKISTASSTSTSDYDPPTSITTSPITRKASIPIATSTSIYDLVISNSQSDRKVSTSSLTSDYDLPNSIVSSPTVRKISIPIVPSTSNYNPPIASSSCLSDRKISTSTSDYDPPNAVVIEDLKAITSTYDPPALIARRTSISNSTVAAPIIPIPIEERRISTSSSVYDPPRRLSGSSNYDLSTAHERQISTSTYDPPSSGSISSSRKTSASNYDPSITTSNTSAYDPPLSSSSYAPLSLSPPLHLKGELKAQIENHSTDTEKNQDQDPLLNLASELLVAVKSLATTASTTSSSVPPNQSISNTPYGSPAMFSNRRLSNVSNSASTSGRSNSIAEMLERRKRESEARRDELDLELKDWEVEDQRGKEERDEIARELEREQDLEKGIEERLEEIKRSIEEMGVHVGVQVATVVRESLQLESRKRSNWLVWTLVVQLVFLWFMMRIINTRSISYFESIYSDPFSSLSLYLAHPSTLNRFNQISAETLSIFAIDGQTDAGLGTELTQIGLKLAGETWSAVKEGLEWFVRS